MGRWCVLTALSQTGGAREALLPRLLPPGVGAGLGERCPHCRALQPAPALRPGALVPRVARDALASNAEGLHVLGIWAWHVLWQALRCRAGYDPVCQGPSWDSQE